MKGGHVNTDGEEDLQDMSSLLSKNQFFKRFVSKHERIIDSALEKLESNFKERNPLFK